jgi:hypothetical protein
MGFTTIYNSPWKKVTSHFCTYTYTGKWAAHLEIKSIGNPHTPTYTYTKVPITTQPINTLSPPHWYTEQKPYVTRNHLQQNELYSPMSSNKTVTASIKYNEP